MRKEARIKSKKIIITMVKSLTAMITIIITIAICFLFYKWGLACGGEFIFYIIIRYIEKINSNRKSKTVMVWRWEIYVSYIDKRLVNYNDCNIFPFYTDKVWNFGGVIFLFSMIGQYLDIYLPLLGRWVVSLEGVGLGDHVWPVLQGTDWRPLFGGKHVVPRYLLVRSDIEE